MLQRRGREQTQDWYERYYTTKGDDRSDPLAELLACLFQNLAFEKSIVGALRQLPGDKRSWKILDVGCGAGFSLLRLLSYGLEPERLYRYRHRGKPHRTGPQTVSRFESFARRCKRDGLLVRQLRSGYGIDHVHPTHR